MITRYLTPLAASVALLVGGAYSYAIDETVPGTALLASGLITLGAWLAIEVSRRREDPGDDE
jgi:hypothetical protein